MSEQSTPSEITKSTEKAEDNTTLLRGALKLETSTSTPVISAGSEFSIYVIIRNPFPVPVTIYSTETHIPIELSDEIWRKTKVIKLKQERLETLNKLQQPFQKLIFRTSCWFSDVYNWLRPDPGPRVAIAVSPEVQEKIMRQEPTSISLNASQEVTVSGDVVGRDKWMLDFAELSSDEIRQILWDINEYIAGRQPVILRPGDSLVKHFVLKTTRWLAFAPIAHTFQIQVRYEVDGKAHIDTVPFSLSIRAAMASSLIGAVFGSILGSFVNKQTGLWQNSGSINEGWSILE